MSTTYFFDWQRKLDVPGKVSFLKGHGDLPALQVATSFANAEIYVQGAHVTRYQKKGEDPLLFLSEASRFDPGLPIRGGIPVIYPWFGPRDGATAHGYARQHPWDLHEITTMPNGSVRLQFRLPALSKDPVESGALVNYSVTIGESLICELTVTNQSEDRPLVFESCLHTYFQVGDISRVSIAGLQGVGFFDKVANFSKFVQKEVLLKIAGETDRVYVDTPGTVEIIDESSRRKIRVDKSGSLSTVVWNPWINKSREMPDFGNEEYKRMICVESGNVADNKIQLPPGQSAALKVKVISNAL